MRVLVFTDVVGARVLREIRRIWRNHGSAGDWRVRIEPDSRRFNDRSHAVFRHIVLYIFRKILKR